MESYKLYSSLPSCDAKKNWAEIDLHSLSRNWSLLLGAVREKAPKTEGIAVVKADAYGHGADRCAVALSHEGCHRFAVSCVEEALALRNTLDEEELEGEILILGYTPPEDAAKLVENNITQCVYSVSYAAALNRAATEPVKVHIKLDTGMNRIGFQVGDRDADTVADEVAVACNMEKLKVEGMFTHFARADEMSVSGDEYTRIQYRRFILVDSALKRRGIDVGFRHVCNSAGALRFPEFALDGVRFGILLYGCGDKRITGLPLAPVMSLYTKISELHILRDGEPLGYGGTYRAKGDRLIATIPIGYADGFIRAYSGATVSVKTHTGIAEATVVGRVCMDQCMLDVTGTTAGVGDTVMIFGSERKYLDGLAARAHTIDYETLCLISARVPRIAVNSANTGANKN